MVLPEAETQRPSFPPFANQFEEVERFRVADYFNNDNAPFLYAASSNNRRPLTIRNINPPTPNFPLLPSPILQRRMDAAPSTPQEPTPGLHRPYRLPSTPPYPDEASLLPPHLRTTSLDMSNLSYDHIPNFRLSHPHSQSPHPLPNRPYQPSRPAPPLPSISLSSSSSSSLSSSTPLRNLLHLSPLNVSLPPLPLPSHQLISLYALRVRAGDILAYGNKLNHGCTVTACYPDERRPDLVLRDDEGDGDGDGRDEGEGGDGADVGVFGGAVKINGNIRIRWRDWRTGEEFSQLFEGLEVLAVRREVGKEGEGEEGD